MRVLIVDDSKPVRSILAKMLRGLDYQVSEAANGQEALQQLRQLDSLGQLDGLDLATVNWQMPVMDGLQLIREIRSDRRLRHLPLVLISAETDRAKVAAALAAGANDYLVKPCSPASLIECLRRLGLPVGGAKADLAACEPIATTPPPAAAACHPTGFVPGNGPIRVLIVDDSAVVRRVLGRLLGEDPELRVIGAATEGHEALRLLGQLSADVVLLDIEMPGLDGLETLKILRQRYPNLPVIMFSSLTERGAKATLDALFLGANDYVPKPGGPEMADPEAGRQAIRQQLAPRIKQFGHARHSGSTSTGPTSLLSTTLGSTLSPATPGTTATIATAGESAGESAARQRPTAGEAGRPLERIEIVAFATSTGGPAALGQLLPQLPANFPVPMVIVQHMPPLFTRYLAERLASDSRLDVREAADGERLGPSQIRIAPGGRHLAVSRRDGQAMLKLTDDAPENACRPSADVLLRSVAAGFGGAALAVVLTGMGKDGLLGCERIRRAGGQVLVQDEATSVVWGMPGQVARAGLADAVLPLGQLAAEICRRTRRGRRDNSW